MALTTWSGSGVRKHDVVVAKNYLSAGEVDTLNRLVVILLEQAEPRAKDRQHLTLDYWRQNVDRLLDFNERPVLRNAGSIGADQAKAIAQERFEAFDAHRRESEALAADAEDLHALENIAKRARDEGAESEMPRLLQLPQAWLDGGGPISSDRKVRRFVVRLAT
ncbi:MAG: virulence RhuM family protein [Sulfuritalea sp.]|nr:virulence RhuM family protein [Sulfuritalea sp.]